MGRRFWATFFLLIPYFAVFLTLGMWLLGRVNLILGMAEIALSIALAIWFFSTRIVGPSAMERKILETGTSAQAKIVGIRPIGVNASQIYALVRLSLMVQSEEGEPFSARVDCVYPRGAAPKIGSDIEVKFDPQTLRVAKVPQRISLK